jgi:hypothetical protein
MSGSDRSGPFGFGPQMLGLGNDALDAWWKMLLENRERMEQLSRSLRGVGGGPAAPVSAEDLAAVVEALTLVENRLDEIDERVNTLAAGMAQIVELLERFGEAQDPDDA